MVTRGRRHEVGRLDQIALAVDDAHQQFVGRRQRVIDQRRDGLGEHDDALVLQGFAHGADQTDFIVPANHALVRVLEHLDTTAATILGGLAGNLGFGDAVVEVQLRGIGRHHAPRHGHRVVGALLRIGADHFATDALGELARLRQVHVRQEDREAIPRQAAGTTLRAHQRTADRIRATRDHAVAVGKSSKIVDDVQAIDVAIEHGQHRVAFAGAHPRLDACPESFPRQQAGERVEILRGIARQQARKTAQAAHGEFVEARLVRTIENDERACGTTARDQGTATSLQAIVPPLLCLSLLVAMGLRLSMQRRASSWPAMASCSRANAASPSERLQTTSASSRAKTAVAAVQPSRRQTAQNTFRTAMRPSALGRARSSQLTSLHSPLLFFVL